jgi:hypothetical protein
MVTGRADADALGRDPHFAVNGTQQKGFAMDTRLRLPRTQPTQQTESRTTLVACSLCLRVLRGSEWLEAERVISEIRSYEVSDSRNPRPPASRSRRLVPAIVRPTDVPRRVAPQR